jgi:hypothetical protein
MDIMNSAFTRHGLKRIDAEALLGSLLFSKRNRATVGRRGKAQRYGEFRNSYQDAPRGIVGRCHFENELLDFELEVISKIEKWFEVKDGAGSSPQEYM